MKKIYKELGGLKERYESGENIIQYLKDDHKELSKIEAILLSYDLQAGSYTDGYEKAPEQKIAFCKEMTHKLEKLEPFDSVLNVGVGEATVLANFISNLEVQPKEIYGFDISWSRAYKAMDFMKRFDINNFTLTTGDLFHSPFMNNSIELVFSNHSLEPNGGREVEALKELYRISSKYVVINEPCYDWASDEAKQRIEKHGYIKNLHLVAENLGYEIVSHEKFENPVSILNPTSCLIIRKHVSAFNKPKLACPITKTVLEKRDGCLFSPESSFSYPIIGGIPCLIEDNAILTSHL